MTNGKNEEEDDRHRIQLDFSPDAYARLLTIRKLAEARTNAEVVRNALRVYEWFLEQKRQGYKVRLVRDGDDHEKEVELII